MDGARFAKIVKTPVGDAILIDGTVINLVAPDGREDEYVELFVTALRNHDVSAVRCEAGSIMATIGAVQAN